MVVKSRRKWHHGP